jgi:hypothetical protein
MSIHTIIFKNNSSLPINIETWQKIKIGLSEMIEETVKPWDSITMNSETGEWILNNYLSNNDMYNEWIKEGYKPGESIGKFRDTPCAKGNYSWMYNDNFEIVYNNGIVTFSKK